MKIEIRQGLPYVSAHLAYRGRQLTFHHVLVDTGSTGSIFQADRLLETELHLESTDVIHELRGVGGTEFVFTKRVDELSLGDFSVEDFEIEVGAMDYGFEIEGIVGMNFLRRVGAVIDLERLEVRRLT